jgi:NAD(P)-dependent dehydrogenase (short-subunit alcohol dehydrogenase family)
MTRTFDLNGRTALVTGGAGTVGMALARALAGAGARIVLSGRDGEALERAAAELGADALAIPADLTADQGPEKLLDAVRSEAGALDILVSNAGIARDAPFGSVGAEDFGDVLALNVTAAYLCAQAAVPLMRDRRGGKIVNVGSIYGSVAPDWRLYEDVAMVRASAPYVASKSALVNLTRQLAVQLAPDNIQVNMLSPGGVEAAQPEQFRQRYEARTPAGRMARPEDLGGTAVYLSSPASDYVTGQNILVDGGFTAW